MIISQTGGKTKVISREGEGEGGNKRIQRMQIISSLRLYFGYQLYAQMI